MTATPNPFEAPSAETSTAARHDDATLRFDTVAPWKAAVLMVATLGLYALYWTYRNFKREAAAGANISPLARAWFHVFFVGRLFQRVGDAEEQFGLVRSASYGLLAVVYVVGMLADGVHGRLPPMGVGVDSAVILTTLTMRTVPLFLIQQRIEGVLDVESPARQRNDGLTWQMSVALVFGALLWGLVAIGLFLPEDV